MVSKTQLVMGIGCLNALIDLGFLGYWLGTHPLDTHPKNLIPNIMLLADLICSFLLIYGAWKSNKNLIAPYIGFTVCIVCYMASYIFFKGPDTTGMVFVALAAIRVLFTIGVSRLHKEITEQNPKPLVQSA